MDSSRLVSQLKRHALSLCFILSVVICMFVYIVCIIAGPIRWSNSIEDWPLATCTYINGTDNIYMDGAYFYQANYIVNYTTAEGHYQLRDAVTLPVVGNNYCENEYNTCYVNTTSINDAVLTVVPSGWPGNWITRYIIFTISGVSMVVLIMGIMIGVCCWKVKTGVTIKTVSVEEFLVNTPDWSEQLGGVSSPNGVNLTQPAQILVTNEKNPFQQTFIFACSESEMQSIPTVPRDGNLSLKIQYEPFRQLLKYFYATKENDVRSLVRTWLDNSGMSQQVLSVSGSVNDDRWSLSRDKTEANLTDLIIDHSECCNIEPTGAAKHQCTTFQECVFGFCMFFVAFFAVGGFWLAAISNPVQMGVAPFCSMFFGLEAAVCLWISMFYCIYLVVKFGQFKKLVTLVGHRRNGTQFYIKSGTTCNVDSQRYRFECREFQLPGGEYVYELWIDPRLPKELNMQCRMVLSVGN